MSHENMKVKRYEFGKDSVLNVYDIFDKDVGDAIYNKDENRKDKKKYNSIKIPDKPNQNHRFFVKLAKNLIKNLNLFQDDETEISIEYLTQNGFVGNIDTYPKSKINQLFAIPSSDKGLPSGGENNMIDPKEQIYMMRLNVLFY